MSSPTAFAREEAMFLLRLQRNRARSAMKQIAIPMGSEMAKLDKAFSFSGASCSTSGAGTVFSTTAGAAVGRFGDFAVRWAAAGALVVGDVVGVFDGDLVGVRVGVRVGVIVGSLVGALACALVGSAVPIGASVAFVAAMLLKASSNVRLASCAIL